MQIDQTLLERELAVVRNQQQQAAHILQQTIGAEKALVGLLGLLGDAAVSEDASRETPNGAEAQ